MTKVSNNLFQDLIEKCFYFVLETDWANMQINPVAPHNYHQHKLVEKIPRHKYYEWKGTVVIVVVG